MKTSLVNSVLSQTGVFGFAALLALAVSASAPATVYCDRPYSELPMNPGLPFNAVGFLNNGCTAVLISNDHIATAGHCLTNSNTGAWQANLRFYPNFHPQRVTSDPMRVPRADVVQGVVGSRVGAKVGDGADWGIARLANWRDAASVNLKPAAIASSVPPAGTKLVNPAYTRHHFPYDDSDSVSWDNMEWDATLCGWVDPDKGMWAMRARPAPFHNGVHRDMTGCNSRWMAGSIHSNCSLAKNDNDLLVHNCSTVGGSSGSPIFFWDTNFNAHLIGIGHGGGAQTFDFNIKNKPVCTPDTPARHDNTAPSVDRFRDAPRFASDIAVFRRPGAPRATGVYAVDSDLDRISYRARVGANPTHNGKFSHWQSLGTPKYNSKLSKVAACAADAASTPQLFVVVDGKAIYRGLNNGPGWQDFGAPASRSRSIGPTILDLDATYDEAGKCVLVSVTTGGYVFVRTQQSIGNWARWKPVASGQYRAVSAINVDGKIWLAMIDQNGDIWRMSGTASNWLPPVKSPRPSGVTAWRDLDFTWDEHARGFLTAIPAGSGDRLWFLPMYGDQAWKQWRYFDTRLWAPEAKDANGVVQAQPAPILASITASRWMEDTPGMTSPVVFATGDDGNVYFIEYKRVGTPGWVLQWKSFYHEFIPYD